MVGENVKSVSVVNAVAPDRILNVITAILCVFFSHMEGPYVRVALNHRQFV